MSPARQAADLRHPEGSATAPGHLSGSAAGHSPSTGSRLPRQSGVSLMCTGSGRAWVANVEVGWCPVGLRDEHRIMPAPQHPLLSVSQGRLIVGNVVPIPAQEPDESTPVT